MAIASSQRTSRLVGTPGNDLLAATADRQLVLGLAGHDTLTSTFNRTTLKGGSGNDVLATSLDGGGTYEEPADLEARQRGGDGADELTMVIRSSGELKNVAEGGSGDDYMRIFAGGGDVRNFVFGGADDDVIYATADIGIFGSLALNRIDSGSGSDIIVANAVGGDLGLPLMRNVVSGGSGNDSVIASTFTNAITGGLSENIVHAGRGHDYVEVTTRTGSDQSSSTANNRVYGGDGNDRISATQSGTGGDLYVVYTTLLDGGSGNDSLSAESSGESEVEASLENVLIGGTGNDELTAGSVGVSQLFGGTGHDRLSVVGGSDNQLDGGAGRDRLTVGDGDDELLGGANADTFVFDLLRDQGTDRLGDFERALDRLAFSWIADAGAPGLADDLDAVSTVTDAGAGQDVTVDFTIGTTLVFAGLGTGSVDSIADLVDDPLDQLLIAGRATGLLDWGETMAIAASQRNSRIIGTPGNDVLAATADRQILLGLGGHDTLTSTFNRTTLKGGSGNDQLTTTLDAGGTYQDPDADLEARQYGGDGADELTIELRAHHGWIKNVADGGNGDDYIEVSGFFVQGGDVRNIVFGGAGSDVIYATADIGDLGQLGVNRIDGGLGSDIIVADAFNGGESVNVDARNVVNSGSGNDTVITFASATPNAAGLSENIIHAGTGNDYIEATTFSGSNVSDSTATNRVYGGAGHDRLASFQSGSGEDQVVTYSTLLDGGDGNDSLTADSESISEQGFGFATLENVLIGATGNDELTARAVVSGYDIMSALNRLSGGSGNDVLTAAALAFTSPSAENRTAQNILEGGAGDDVLTGRILAGGIPSASSWSRLFGGTGNDQLTVSGGLDNLLVGGSGNDSLRVIFSNSLLTGGSGNDSLESGFADDDLLGGAGADTFIFRFILFGGGTDRLGDFDGAEDRLAFRLFEDAGAPGLADDLDAITTVTDLGAGLDVTVDFTSGTTLVFAGLGTGSIDSIADLVDDPASQLLLIA